MKVIITLYERFKNDRCGDKAEKEKTVCALAIWVRMLPTWQSSECKTFESSWKRGKRWFFDKNSAAYFVMRHRVLKSKLKSLKFNSWPGRGKRRPCCTSRWRRVASRRAEGSRSKREGRMRTEPWTLSAQLLRAGIRYLVRSASARDPFRWARCGRRRGCWPRCLWPTPGEERWLHFGECFGYFLNLHFLRIVRKIAQSDHTGRLE